MQKNKDEKDILDENLEIDNLRIAVAEAIVKIYYIYAY